jgi:hypothetical protein
VEPGHAGQPGDQRAQGGGEAAEEHRRPAPLGQVAFGPVQMLVGDQAADRAVQQPPAPAPPDQVTDAVADDGAGDRGGQDRGEGGAVLEGQDPAQQHGDLAGDDHPEEGGGLQGGGEEDHGQHGPAVQAQDAVDQLPQPSTASHTGSGNACYTTPRNWELLEDVVGWLLLVVRLPAEPSRHRVAVWRELRRAGALSLGQGVWAVPQVGVFTQALDRAVQLAQRGEGEAIVLEATGRAEGDAARLEALFTEAREAEWAEFLADCAKYEAELDQEIAKGKFTLAELEEEEQSLERLRRWHRDLRARDLFGAPSAAEADQRLKHCAERLEGYTDRVFHHLHQA